MGGAPTNYRRGARSKIGGCGAHKLTAAARPAQGSNSDIVPTLLEAIVVKTNEKLASSLVHALVAPECVWIQLYMNRKMQSDETLGRKMQSDETLGLFVEISVLNSYKTVVSVGNNTLSNNTLSNYHSGVP